MDTYVYEKGPFMVLDILIAIKAHQDPPPGPPPHGPPSPWRRDRADRDDEGTQGHGDRTPHLHRVEIVVLGGGRRARDADVPELVL